MSEPRGEAVPEPRKARLFVAVVPPDGVLDQIEVVPRPSVPGVRWTRRPQWHVTLRFFGSTEVEPVVDALAACHLRRTEAVLGPQVGRLGQRVLMVPVAGLDDLAHRVVAATRDLGRPPEQRTFFGHLTLARLEGRPACGLTDAVVRACWPVDEVALVRSTLRRTGAEYDVVATFPCT